MVGEPVGGSEPYSILTGRTYSVQQYPLLWLLDLYYNQYKDNTFFVSPLKGSFVYVGNAADYAKVTTISLINQALTTDFTEEMLGHFPNLESLIVFTNLISVLETTLNPKLKELRATRNNLTNTNNLSNNPLLEKIYLGYNNLDEVILPPPTENLKELYLYGNNITNVDLTGYTKLIEVSLSINPIDSVAFSNLPSIVIFRCHTTNITTLNASLFGNTLKTLVIDNNRFTLPTLKTILGQLVGKMTNGFIQGNFLNNALLFTNTSTSGVTLQNVINLTNAFEIQFELYLNNISTTAVLLGDNSVINSFSLVWYNITTQQLFIRDCLYNIFVNHQ